MLTIDQVKELMDLVSEKKLARFEIERAGFRLRIDGVAPQSVVQSAAPAAQPPVTDPRSTDTDGAAHDGTAPDPDLHVLKSPIVGTFFAAPAPDADPFVSVGDRVTKGQVVCIVEAMKLMNEIEADADGEIVEIYGLNGEPVEFGQPLFGLETD